MDVRCVSGVGELHLGEQAHQQCGSGQGGLDSIKRLLQRNRPVQHLGITFEALRQGLECEGGSRQETGLNNEPHV